MYVLLQVHKRFHLSKFSDKCPDDWKIFEDSCYFYHDTSTDLTGAQRFCKGKESKVLVINSEEENEFISKSFGGKSMWLGMKLDQNTMTWKLLNGEEATFNKFHKLDRYSNYDHYRYDYGYVSNYYRDVCVLFHAGYQFWKSVLCYHEYPVVCESPVAV